MFIDPDDTTPRELDPSPASIVNPGDGRSPAASPDPAMSADIAIADDAADRPTAAPSLCELHRRWAALEDEISKLDLEINEMIPLGTPRPELSIDEHRLFPENLRAELDRLRRMDVSSDTLRLGEELRRRLAEIENNPTTYAPLQEAARNALAASRAEFAAVAAGHGVTARIDRLEAATEELDRVLAAIWETPATTIADIAALLDIALQQPEMATPGAATVWKDWPYWCLLTEQLHALAPEAEFTWLHRPAFTGDDLVAEVLGKADEDQAEVGPPIAAE